MLNQLPNNRFLSTYLIIVDAIDTFAVDARVVNAIVVVLLAVLAPGPGQTPTFVAIGTVNANPPILTGICQALVNWPITQETSVAGMTIALKIVGTS